MAATLRPPPSSGQPAKQRSHRHVALAGAAVVVAAGASVGIGLAVSSSSSPSPAPTAASSYAYYQQMMGRYGAASGGMMGGNYSRMTGRTGYGWMMGGASAPGWMAGGTLPGFMMGSSTDMGEVMGQLFADAPGPRVSTSDTAALATQLPAGANIDKVANSITFTASNVAYAVVASPPGADDKFETAGLVNPTIIVPRGAHVSVQFVNADTTSAHGYVITAAGASASGMPMTAYQPAFAGAAAWFLGDATAAGAQSATISFTPSTSGSYQYICPVPGHAQRGMAAGFVVAS